jgi:protein O-GlcNAc transferase
VSPRAYFPRAGSNQVTTLASLAAKIAASGLSQDAVAAVAAFDLESSTDLPSIVAIGDALRGVNQLILAERCYRRARALAPHIFEIAFVEAEVIQLIGRSDEARVLLAGIGVAAAAPAHLRDIACLKAACVLPQIIPSEDRIVADRARIAAAVSHIPAATVPDAFLAGGFPNFYLAYQGENDRALQESLARFYLRFSPSLTFEAPHVRSPRAGGRIRLGLLSRHFFTHTIAYLNEGLIVGLDRDRFDLTLIRIPTGMPPDDTALALARSAGQVCDLPLDLVAARAKIAALNLDVLHYPDLGMDTLGYFLAFARLARVQTVGWGHPVTTGIPNIDAFLSVDAMEPADGADHYSEKLVRLTAAVPTVAAPRVAQAMDKAAFGIDPTRPVYLCPQSLFKVHPSFDRITARLLARDPAGVIYFLGLWEPLNSIFLARLRASIGLAAERVRLLPRVRVQQFPELLSCADVILDIPEWSGGKTSLEALARGIPIVHLPGRFMRGRHTLAFYKQMALMDCVAADTEDYAALAVRLVHDAEFRARIRGEIKARAPRLFDQPGAVREVEDYWAEALAQNSTSRPRA